MSSLRRPSAHVALALAVMCASEAKGQVTYSVDEQSPTSGLFDAVGAGPITGGDVLTSTPPVGPPPTPTIFIPGGPAGLGIAPTPLGFTEVDALSYGLDDPIFQQQILSYYYFSVDEFAIGFPGPPPLPPNVTTEGPGPAGLGPSEASADVYVFPWFPFPAAAPPGPLPPGPPIGHTGVFDGNGGFTPFPSPTLNLIEPNPPTLWTFMGPDPGDNLDALDVETPAEFPGVYFSLDAAFPDPLEVPVGAAAPPNTATALANGFVGGDVLVAPGGVGPPALYAAALAVGLDLAGPGTDDLDALILNDTMDGMVGVYTPTTGPYSWFGGTDMLLYSVRRGSALVGVPDGLFGAPIEEGDILIPLGPGAVPGIWIAAEVLGLATIRSGTAAVYGIPNPDYPGLLAWADDLDALDHSRFRIPEPSTIVLAMLAAMAGLAARKDMS